MLLRPFKGIIEPNRLQVPTGKLRINRRHPLGYGLQVCWVPGATFQELTGQAPSFTPIDSSSIISMTREGPGLLNGSGTVSFAAPSQKDMTEWSVYWRGYQFGALSGFASLIVCSYDNIGSSPFAAWGIISNSGGTIWEIGGNGYDSPGNAQIANPGNGFYSIGGRSKPSVGGSIFLNGVFQNSGTGPGTTGTATSQLSFGSTNVITCIALMWNRQLSDSEFALLEQDPYGFLNPDTFDLPVVPSDFRYGDDVLDAGIDLDAVALANKIVICSQRPFTYTEAVTTFNIGAKSMGIGGCFTASTATSDGSGVQVSSVAVSNGSVTTSGTPTYWAVVDDANTRMVARGRLTGGTAVVSGNTWSLTSFAIVSPGILLP